MVNKVPEQSLLNTASWKYLIPQLYRKYPNDDMILNMSLTSPPDVWITSKKVGANLLLDMTVNVLDGSSTIPVACISMVITIEYMLNSCFPFYYITHGMLQFLLFLLHVNDPSAALMQWDNYWPNSFMWLITSFWVLAVIWDVSLFNWVVARLRD